jgi:hypothetical protein
MNTYTFAKLKTTVNINATNYTGALEGLVFQTGSEAEASKYTFCYFTKDIPSAAIPGLWNLRPAIDDRGAEYGLSYRICDGSGALVAIAETEALAQSIINAHNNAAPALTVEQRSSLRCAYTDLKGALEEYESGNLSPHDWNAHQISIDDLEKAFPFITE